jgi:hypothetical protein
MVKRMNGTMKYLNSKRGDGMRVIEVKKKKKKKIQREIMPSNLLNFLL